MGSSTSSWAIALCGLFLGIALASAPALSAAPAEWSLDKQEDGIEVYTRPVEGSGIKEFRGIADVDVDVETILDLLRDSSRFKTWFPNTPESRLLEREGDVTYQYSVMGMPWPMEKRDNVLRAITRRDDESGAVDIEVTAAPDYYPPQAGRLRIRKAHGNWRLEPIAPDKTRVIFTMHLEPGGGIPQWLINARVVAAPFEALTNLRAILGR